MDPEYTLETGMLKEKKLERNEEYSCSVIQNIM